MLDLQVDTIISACWVIFFFKLLLSFADFSKLTCSKSYFKNTIRMSNSLDPDQGPDSLQRIPADSVTMVLTLSLLAATFVVPKKVATSKERVNTMFL